MKKQYEKPEIEIEVFEIEDTITASTLNNNECTGDEGGWGGPGNRPAPL